MIYIYNAGPMFSEADIVQRQKEGRMFKEVLDANECDYFLANPIDLPFDNTREIPPSEIFMTDYSHVDKANVFFFDLATNDAGTYVELGNAIEKLMSGKKLHIYPIFSDLRIQRNNIAGIECPVGFNSYLVGSLTANHLPLYRSFDEAFAAFCADFDLKK